ncbi:MAG TPA: DUF2997 domain-containing protein [Anaerohalosphaeraceae bacterium]|jgi:acylphosphatase|nr:DUF2997 domain-containing protein [Anaerohalosphaeraceae bacterium]
MAQHEIEITIAPDGQVKVHVKGAKGKTCMEYAKWLTQVIGKVKDQKLTSEYYEPETKAKIHLTQELRQQQ